MKSFSAYLYRDLPLIVELRRGSRRTIPPERWYIDRNTPVGEPADVYERMPHGGKRYISWEKIIGQPERVD